MSAAQHEDIPNLNLVQDNKYVDMNGSGIVPTSNNATPENYDDAGDASDSAS